MTPPLLDLSLPDAWQRLTPGQLRHVYTLQASGSFAPAEVRLLCLMGWAGLRLLPPRASTPAGHVVVARGGSVYLLAVADLEAASRTLCFLDTPPAEPVRLAQWNGYRAATPLLRELPFGRYLLLENLWQGYLLTRTNDALDALAALLYDAPSAEALRPTEVLRYAVACWMAAVKARFASEWPDLFRPAAGRATPPDMAAIMNAELRALTGGDVTREQAVRDTGCWRALEELNAKAREAAEFNRRPPATDPLPSLTPHSPFRP